MAKKHPFHSIKKYGILPAWITALTHWHCFAAFMSYMKIVSIDFFMIQFLQRHKLSRTPVIHVDNDLDEKVPFTPSKINDYLGFVSFWIRPLSMMADVLGRKTAKKYQEEYLHYIAKAYKEASDLYKYCMTTTARPKYYKNKYFVLIHMFDPHFLCVPSLHIAVVTLCFSYFRNLLQMPEFTDEQREKWIPEIYADAINIAETVLYVKQHSVNCVPAALYMMTFIMRPYFTAEDGVKFLNDMFKNSTDISEADKKSLIEYMQFIYERFLLEGVHNDDWKVPVKRWLKEYAAEHGQQETASLLR